MGNKNLRTLKYNSYTTKTFKLYRILKYHDVYNLQTLLLVHEFKTGTLPPICRHMLTFHPTKNRKTNIFERQMPHFKKKLIITETVAQAWIFSNRNIEKLQEIFKSKFKEKCFSENAAFKCTKHKCCL